MLVAELHKRFTPVYLQAVQSSLFHDQKQKPGELVDHFAQELRVLFYKTYPYAQQGTLEAERLGQLVLVNQFVAGLLEDIKVKVVGIEGSFDQLLAKARFEKAKLWDLNATNTGSKSSGVSVTSNITDPVPSVQSSSRTTANGSYSRQQRLTTPRFNVGGQRDNARCYNCGSPSHLIRQYPCLVKNRATETPGTGMAGQPTDKGCVSNVTSAGTSSDDHEQLTESEKEASHCEPTDVDIGEDINNVFITMHGVTSSDVQAT